MQPSVKSNFIQNKFLETECMTLSNVYNRNSSTKSD